MLTLFFFRTALGSRYYNDLCSTKEAADTERLSNLPRTTQPINSRAGTQAPAVGLQNLSCSFEIAHSCASLNSHKKQATRQIGTFAP